MADLDLRVPPITEPLCNIDHDLIADFYAALTAAVGREGGSSDKWLPADWDWKRLELEHASAWEIEIRRIVRELIVRSLRSGHPYQAEFHNYSLTALARAADGETYLVVGTRTLPTLRSSQLSSTRSPA